MIDISKVDMNAPAFSDPKEDTSENATTEESQTESGKEEKERPTSDGGSDDEQKVPYSRLQEVVRARREAEERAAELEAKYEALERERNQPREQVSSGYDQQFANWLRMYGDNPNSREAYRLELERQRAFKEEARREALQAVREERQTESKIIAQNERSIDSRLEDLSEGLGRPLSENEAESILDIMDDYTPKDRQGNYAGELISVEKAWEIYNMQQGQSGVKSSKSRSRPTALTSTRTEGETTGQSESDKNWDPRDWNSYKKRLPKQ